MFSLHYRSNSLETIPLPPAPPDHSSDPPSSFDSLKPPPSLLHDLPSYQSQSPPDFVWGDLDGALCVSLINQCYNEAIHWKHSYFTLPCGHTGESFVSEFTAVLLSRLPLKALPLELPSCCQLLSFRNSNGIKLKVEPSYIERRTALWRLGKFEELMKEGKTIQSTFNRNTNGKMNTPSHFNMGHTVDSLLHSGNVNQAIRVISNKSKGGLLRISDHIDPTSPSSPTVCEILKKHPPTQALDPAALSSSQIATLNSCIILFSLTRSMVP